MYVICTRFKKKKLFTIYRNIERSIIPQPAPSCGLVVFLHQGQRRKLRDGNKKREETIWRASKTKKRQNKEILVTLEWFGVKRLRIKWETKNIVSVTII